MLIIHWCFDCCYVVHTLRRGVFFRFSCSKNEQLHKKLRGSVTGTGDLNWSNRYSKPWNVRPSKGKAGWKGTITVHDCMGISQHDCSSVVFLVFCYSLFLPLSFLLLLLLLLLIYCYFVITIVNTIMFCVRCIFVLKLLFIYLFICLSNIKLLFSQIRRFTYSFWFSSPWVILVVRVRV